MGIIEKAEQVYKENFPAETCFERAIFFSWYCGIKDCAFCYMSTQNTTKKARRSVESLLAEAILCKKLGWDIGFVSGGHDAYTTVEFEKVLKLLSEAAGERLWINVGALGQAELERFRPWVKGVVASIETVNPEVHDKVCPSKPVEPFENMLDRSGRLGLRKAMTIILGLGETVDDFGLLEAFIRKHGIQKIHFYSLNPQKGTVFEKAERPTAEYQAEWIARTRVAFPKMDIQAGIWLDCTERVGLLLRAGANSISKFPALKRFGSEEARNIERQARSAGRGFRGTLTSLPEWDVRESLRAVPQELGEHVASKLAQYLGGMGYRHQDISGKGV
jgi:biotin synthase-like enzyme